MGQSIKYVKMVQHISFKKFGCIEVVGMVKCKQGEGDLQKTAPPVIAQQQGFFM